MNTCIDPAAWLAAHDIKSYIDAPFSDPLVLGREALSMAGGDLLTACQQQEDLRAEIALAWLAEQIERQPECAGELVRVAAEVVEDSSRPA